MSTIIFFQDGLGISAFWAWLLLALFIIGVGLLLLPSTYTIHKGKSLRLLFFEVGADPNYSKPTLNINDDKEPPSEPLIIRSNVFILRLVGLCLIIAVLLIFYATLNL